MNLSQVLTINDTICDEKGGVFTGEVWTDDNHTAYMRVVNGKVQNIFSYHENGKVVIDHKFVGESGDDDVYTFFDMMGNVISKEAFDAQFQNVWGRMEQQDLLTKIFYLK